jgi:hypothetical protein
MNGGAIWVDSGSFTSVGGHLNATECSFKNNAAPVRGEFGSVILLQSNMHLSPLPLITHSLRCRTNLLVQCPCMGRRPRRAAHFRETRCVPQCRTAAGWCRVRVAVVHR